MPGPHWLEPPTLAELDAEDEARRDDLRWVDVSGWEFVDNKFEWRRSWWESEFPGWDWTERPLPYPSPDQETEQ